jgi:hypothetical protein
MRLRTTIITNEPTLIALVLAGLGGGVAPSMRGPADLHGEGWGENYSTSAGGGAVRGNMRCESTVRHPSGLAPAGSTGRHGSAARREHSYKGRTTRGPRPKRQ